MKGFFITKKTIYNIHILSITSFLKKIKNGLEKLHEILRFKTVFLRL